MSPSKTSSTQGGVQKSPSKGFSSPGSSTSPTKSSNFSTAVAPVSPAAIQSALAKIKEVTQSTPSCNSITEADLMACLQLSSPTGSARMATFTQLKEPDPELKIDEQTILLNALLSSLNKLNLEGSQNASATAGKTPPCSPAPGSAKHSPLKRTPSSLGKIQENLSEDLDSPRSIEQWDDCDDGSTDTTILAIDEAKRCLRGGSMASRIKFRRQKSLKDLEEKRVNEVVEKLNRPSIIQHTMPRRLSVVDPKTRSLSRVNSLDDIAPALSRKSSFVSESSPRGALSHRKSSVTFAPPPVPTTLNAPKLLQEQAYFRKKKKKFQQHARMSTLATHIKKLLTKSDRAKRNKPQVNLDASNRVSNMKLGTSPKKCKFKHEDFTTYTRPNCRPRRYIPKTGEPLLEREQSYISLEVIDNVGTRAACPVHLLSEKSKADFSYVTGVVNSHNRRRRRSTRRSKLTKRPSLWIVD